MIRPTSPLVCHADVVLKRDPKIGYHADLNFLNIPHVVELHSDFKFFLFAHRWGHEDPFKMDCQLVKHPWGYGGTGEIGTFPFYVAVLKDGQTIRSEIWGEPPRQGGKLHPEVEAIIERMAKRVRA